MHELYDHLQKEGITGPFMKVDGKMIPRPNYRAEYPKSVKNADGKIVVVQSLREEAQVAGQAQAPDVIDPLRSEREALNAESEALAKSRSEVDVLVAEMRTQLAALAEQRAAPSKPAPEASKKVPIAGMKA